MAMATVEVKLASSGRGQRTGLSVDQQVFIQTLSKVL